MLWKQDPRPEKIPEGVNEVENEEENEEENVEEYEEECEEEIEEDVFDPEVPRAFTEAEEIPTTYKAADSWEGLEVVGGKESPLPETFQGFLPKERASNNDQITAALHRAVVEVYALYQAGESLKVLGRPLLEQELQKDITSEVQFVKIKQGAGLKYPEEQTQREILESLVDRPSLEEPSMLKMGEVEMEDGEVEKEKTKIPTDSEKGDETKLSSSDSSSDAVEIKNAETEKATDSQKDTGTRPLPNASSGKTRIIPAVESAAQKAQAERDESLKKTIASWDPLWLSVSLQHNQIRFAVLKRILQLTGIRIRDPQIAEITDVKSLLHILSIKPKPRKLAESVELTEKLNALPNVKFSAKRVTPVDKEITLGRWKIIKKELERRDLPVLGKTSIMKRVEL